MSATLMFDREARRLVMAVRSLDSWGLAASDKLQEVVVAFCDVMDHRLESPARHSAAALCSICLEHLRLGWDDARVDAMDALADLVEQDLQSTERMVA